MKELILTPEQLMNIVANNECVGRGTYGLVIKLDEDTLFKFKYKDLISVLNYENGKFSITNVNDLIKILTLHRNVMKVMNGNGTNYEVTLVKGLTERQPNVKKTSLTQGVVLCNGCVVGYLLKYHKNMVNLYKYLTQNNIEEKEKKIILKTIKEKMNELIENGVYLRDFTTHNMMYNSETKDVQIIDFEDSLSLREPKYKEGIKSMEKQFNDINRFLSKKSLEL